MILDEMIDEITQRLSLVEGYDFIDDYYYCEDDKHKCFVFVVTENELDCTIKICKLGLSFPYHIIKK